MLLRGHELDLRRDGRNKTLRAREVSWKHMAVIVVILSSEPHIFIGNFRCFIEGYAMVLVIRDNDGTIRS